MNKNWIKYALTAIGIIGFITSLVFFILSISVYSDEWGTDISSNNDCITYMVVSLILFNYGLMLIMKKDEEMTKLLPTIAVSGAIITLYDLGVFLKAWMKAIAKGNEFDFLSSQMYLYIGLAALIITVTASCFMMKKRKEQN